MTASTTDSDGLLNSEEGLAAISSPFLTHRFDGIEAGHEDAQHNDGGNAGNEGDGTGNVENIENAHSSADDMLQFHRRIRILQIAAMLVAHFFALMSLAVVIQWISLLGGLSWKKGEAKLVFNWHPLLMITSYAFMTVATLSFRLPMSRSLSKSLHAAAWLVASISAFIALVAVFQSHNDRTSGLVANMYSLHSWIGAFVILLFVAQFLAGTLTFAWPLRDLSASYKAKMLLFHKYVGPIVYLATGATILLGIQEKEGFIGCSYAVSKPDIFPIEHYGDIPFPCKISHMLGLCVSAMLVCTTFTLHDFGHRSENTAR